MSQAWRAGVAKQDRGDDGRSRDGARKFSFRFDVLLCPLHKSRSWGIALGRSRSIQFHVVRSGKCWIRLEGGPEVELKLVTSWFCLTAILTT
jgi:hypothetical protein